MAISDNLLLIANSQTRSRLLLENNHSGVTNNNLISLSPRNTSSINYLLCCADPRNVQGIPHSFSFVT